MEVNNVTQAILDCSINIHKKLGPGLLEEVYQRILSYELRKKGYQVETEIPIPVYWDNNKIDLSYRADMIVNKCVLVELKAIEKTSPVHRKQTLT